MLFEVDDVVRVVARTGVGENKPGGVGRIVQVSDDGVDVKYVLGGRERCVPLEYVERYSDVVEQQRSKRTVHGRCRRCGSLVVDCLHAQPDVNDEDDTRRRALAKRKKVARSWKRAMGASSAVAEEDDVAFSSSSSSSSDDSDADATQPIDDDDDLPETQPLDDESDDQSTAVDEESTAVDEDVAAEGEEVSFIAAEDDGDSMPADLAGLAPSKRATTRCLRRRMERVQRFVGTRGLRHARHEVAALRVRANGVYGKIALRDLERAASNVRAFVLGGLRRRGVDVADACYRRLASKGARAGLDAAARKQDLLDDALREVETDLDTLVDLARDRCSEASRARGGDDDDEMIVSGEDIEEHDEDDDAKLFDIWGWEINLSEEKGILGGSKQNRRRSTQCKRRVNGDIASLNRRSPSRVEARSGEIQEHAPRRTPDARRVRFVERDSEPSFSSLPPRKVAATSSTAPSSRRRQRRVSVISSSRLAALYGPHRATRFGKWVVERRGRDDDAEAACLLRRLIDDGAAGVEGARFEDSARSCRREALELLRSCKLTHVEWEAFVPAAAATSIDAAERAAGHRTEDLAQIEELRLWLLGRAADETSDAVLRLALSRCLVLVSLRERASDDEQPVAARAWRAAAPTSEMWRALEADCLSGVGLADRFRVATCAARAMSAEPSRGDPRATWALIPKDADFRGGVGITCACRLATAMCAAGAGANNEVLWRLWDAAVAELGSTASTTPREEEEAPAGCWVEAVGRRISSTRLALVAPSSRYFSAQQGEPSLVRAATETVVCFSSSHPPGMHRKRVTLELVRRRALKAVSENAKARPLVLSCLVSLARAGLVDVDAGLVRTASTATATERDEDAALAASALAKLAITDDAKRAACAWVSDLEATTAQKN